MALPEPPPPSPTPQPESIVGKVSSEGAELTVVSVTKHSKMGIWIIQNEGDVFLKEVILKNISREKIQGNSLYFTVKDENGVNYGHSMASIEPRFPLGDILPGESAEGNATFNVPETAKGFILSFQDFLMFEPLSLKLGL